jgi:hypothetical protein
MKNGRSWSAPTTILNLHQEVFYSHVDSRPRFV